MNSNSLKNLKTNKSDFVTRYGATKRTVANKLRKIANVLEKYGWCQGTFGYDAKGPHCLVGAAWYPPTDYIDNTEFILFLNDYIGKGPGALVPASVTVVEWNDTPGRTKWQVIGMLRMAASDLEHGWHVA